MNDVVEVPELAHAHSDTPLSVGAEFRKITAACLPIVCQRQWERVCVGAIIVVDV